MSEDDDEDQTEVVRIVSLDLMLDLNVMMGNDAYEPVLCLNNTSTAFGFIFCHLIQ